MSVHHAPHAEDGGWRGRPAGVPSTVPPPWVPLSFFLASAVGMVGCGVALWWFRSFALLDPTDDHVVAVAHLAMLATLSMALIGALHQFIPVITQRPLKSTRLSLATLVCWTCAAWLLPIGFATVQETVVEVGGFFAATAVTLLVVNVFSALSAPGKCAPVTGLRWAVGGFVVTACYGVVYVVDRRGNWFDLNGHVVLAHAVVGLFGWLGLAYVSVSERLWSLFLLAHVPGRRRAAWSAVRLIPGGVAVLSTGLLVGRAWLGWCGALILAAGLGSHLISLIQHVRRRQRRVDLHLCFVVTSALWLPVGATFAIAACLHLARDHHVAMSLTAAAISAIGGWLLVAIVGHAHKVVPFIFWTLLRGRGVKESVNGTQLMFADLYDHRFAVVSYVVINGAIVAMSLGFASSDATLLALGATLLIVTGLCTTLNLSLTVRGYLSRARRGALSDSSRATLS